MSTTLDAIASARSTVGRHGVVRARFEQSHGRTILRDSFFRVPLQIIRPLYSEGDSPAHLTLINPSGGYVGGDRLEADFHLGKGSRVLLTTQGATKVYRTMGAPVLSQTHIHLEEDTVLELVPDPLIPYAGSKYRQEVEVEMHEGAQLLYGETVYHGRVASGESFDYASLALRFRTAMNGAPLLHDAMVIDPARMAVQSLGLFEPHPYMGTFYFLGGSPDALDRAAERADALFAGAKGAAGGASRLEGPGVIVRWLAESPVRLKWFFDEVWNIFRVSALGRPAVRLRKF